MCYISHYIYTQQDQITTLLVEYLVKHNQENLSNSLRNLTKIGSKFWQILNRSFKIARVL